MHLSLFQCQTPPKVTYLQSKHRLATVFPDTRIKEMQATITETDTVANVYPSTHTNYFLSITYRNNASLTLLPVPGTPRNA